MYFQNNGVDLQEVNRLVTSATTSLTSLKDNVTSFWGGPAAMSYQDILTQSVDFSRLTNLLSEIDCEIGVAMERLAREQAGIC